LCNSYAVFLYEGGRRKDFGHDPFFRLQKSKKIWSIRGKRNTYPNQKIVRIKEKGGEGKNGPE